MDTPNPKTADSVSSGQVASNNEPLVSVLIPCYNAERYIGETLDSVIAQTYPHWECIVVDDHSTDNSVEIVQSYCRRYPDKIFLYTNPRKGACAARNVAFEKSKGEFIQYLDADDLLEPNKIENQMNVFQTENQDIIVSGRWGRFFKHPGDVKWEKQEIDKDYPNPIDWLCDSWLGKGMAPPNVWLSPRHLIEKAGLWNETLQINQDGEFFCRVLMHASSIRFCSNSKVFYRSGLTGSVSQSGNKTREKASSLLKSYRKYEIILSTTNNNKVRKALGNNYLWFIYQFHHLYPDLSIEAEQFFRNLGLKKMWPVGGWKFRLFSRIIGFKRSLMLKKI